MKGGWTAEFQAALDDTPDKQFHRARARERGARNDYREALYYVRGSRGRCRRWARRAAARAARRAGACELREARERAGRA